MKKNKITKKIMGVSIPLFLYKIIDDVAEKLNFTRSRVVTDRLIKAFKKEIKEAEEK